ncbi:MAG: hypothetical protein ONB55_22450 [candidate division KSB1 bacterium]|nr:hypothetical protein [candidate division KSB1 bacterium]
MHPTPHTVRLSAHAEAPHPTPLLLTTPTIPTPAPGVLDWGIAIAVLLFIAKTGFDFFKEKDKSEAELTTSLISDLRMDARLARETQTTTLQRLTNLQERTTENLASVGKALDKLALADQAHKRDVAMMTVQQRDIQEKLIILGQQVKAVHERLDKFHVPHSGERGNG